MKTATPIIQTIGLFKKPPSPLVLIFTSTFFSSCANVTKDRSIAETNNAILAAVFLLVVTNKLFMADYFRLRFNNQ